MLTVIPNMQALLHYQTSTDGTDGGTVSKCNYILFKNHLKIYNKSFINIISTI